MIQKIIKVGNSYAVTIPKSLFAELGITRPQQVSLQSHPSEGRVILDFTPDQVQDVVDKEVYVVAKDLLKRYLPAFKELAKR